MRPVNVCAPHCTLPAVATTAPVIVTTALEPSSAEATVVSGSAVGGPDESGSGAARAVPKVTSRSAARDAPEAVRATDRLMVRM